MNIHFDGLIDGAILFEPEPIWDDRGYFAEVLRFAEGLSWVQQNITMNILAGTLRGLHYQEAPHQETKLIRCIRGSIFDIQIDLRPESSTYQEWSCVELSEKNMLALLVPRGVAHGYQTLEPNTQVFYQVSEHYHPESAKTIKWNDPKYDIKWPLPVSAISEKDK